MPRRASRLLAIGLAAGVAAAAIGAIAHGPVPLRSWAAHPIASFMVARGETPYPIRLVRPSAAPLSAMAELGRLIFFDPGLSSSGRLACTSCHGLEHAYGPPGTASVMAGGAALSRQGVRAVPSLMYLERQPNFSIGPDDAENETVDLFQQAALGRDAPRAQKTATDSKASTANLVPQGGLFWDGRADTLQQQALSPLLSPFEMDGGSIEAVAAKLQRAPYAPRFAQLFGHDVFDTPQLTLAEALFAVARYQIEEPSFHP